jgi:hypothetical protein
MIENEIAKENRDNCQLLASMNNHFSFMFAMLNDIESISTFIKITRQSQINEIISGMEEVIKKFKRIREDKNNG